MTHRITIAGTDVGFSCAEGQTVLDAGLAAGIEMPYSCRKGVCGNCAGVVAQGEVAAAGGVAMRNEACAEDEVLFCACTPCGDVTVAPKSWQRIDPGARKVITAKVYRNERAAPDVSILQLRLPPGQRAKFKAGQYLQVLLEDGETRSYSMANPPQQSDGVTLHIRHVPGGRFTALVPDLAPGDTLRIELPYGSFMLEDDERPMVCVAGGTGFAPIHAILEDMVKRRVRRPVTLIWGARTDEGLYLLPALARWQKHLPDLRFVPAISDAAASDVPDAFLGLAHEALLQRFDSLAGHALYCCGAPGMVSAVRDAAVGRLGLEPHDFHADVFVPGGAAAP